MFDKINYKVCEFVIPIVMLCCVFIGFSIGVNFTRGKLHKQHTVSWEDNCGKCHQWTNNNNFIERMGNH